MLSVLFRNMLIGFCVALVLDARAGAMPEIDRINLDFHADSSGNDIAARAAEMCQYGRYDEAKTEIEKALVSDAAKNAYTWYVKGFIYKEVYKISAEKNIKFEARDIAVKAFMHAKGLVDYDPKTFNVDLPLKFLIGTLYSDALMEAGTCQMESLQASDLLMHEFSRLAPEVGLDADLRLRKADYEKTVSMRFFNLWLTEITRSELYITATERMTRAIELNPDDCMSMYNIAVFHFKMAEAGKAGKLTCDHEGELDIALSEMHKAESRCNDNGDILRGILNIYKMKQDAAMVSEYEQRIASVQKNQLIKN